MQALQVGDSEAHMARWVPEVTDAQDVSANSSAGSAASGDADASARTDRSDPERLSVIPEGDDESGSLLVHRRARGDRRPIAEISRDRHRTTDTVGDGNPTLDWRTLPRET